MADLPTFEELYDLGKAEVLSRNPGLDDWEPGSGNDAYIGGGAVVADQVIRVVIDRFAALFLDTAEGQDLLDLAEDRFGLRPHPASSAVVTVTWTRSTSGAYTIPAGTRFRARVGSRSVVFTADADTPIGAGQASVEIAATSTATGHESNVAAGTVTEVVDPVPADPGATVTNPMRAAGGAPAEPHSRFRDRVRRYFPTLRRGTPEALEVGALSVPGVWFATVDEREIESSGHVLIYVGDPDGEGNELLADAVAAEIVHWRAAGVLVRVLPAAREEVDLRITARIRAGVDGNALKEAMRIACAAHVEGLPPGATLYLSQVARAALRVSPDVLDAVVSSRNRNVTPSAPQNAIRLASGSPTFNVIEVEV